MSISGRVAKAERQVGAGREPVVVNIVNFGGKPLPAEEQRGNIIIRHVAYESIEARREGGAGHED